LHPPASRDLATDSVQRMAPVWSFRNILGAAGYQPAA
jgi:hypothetical protein